jgi:hypothetical protein
MFATYVSKHPACNALHALHLTALFEVRSAYHHEQYDDDNKEDSTNNEHHFDVLPPHGILQLFRSLLELLGENDINMPFESIKEEGGRGQGRGDFLGKAVPNYLTSNAESLSPSLFCTSISIFSPRPIILSIFCTITSFTPSICDCTLESSSVALLLKNSCKDKHQ